MKTEKLYYKDAYIKEFDATVLSCEQTESYYDVVLDKTAFFPEAGGQTSDKGYIGNSRVIDAREIDSVIHHYVENAINVNDCVHCALDFEERHNKMRSHTAEHIVSGLFHSLYGIENTGFHLGSSDVTFDTSEVVTAEMLMRVERLANEAVCKNVPVTAYMPADSELESLEYRSKLDLKEDVRIVHIEGYDDCACCAPHVAYTGEIGMIKFLDAVKHKSGSRIRMLAGMDAYDYLSEVTSEAHRISVLLCAPMTEVADEVERLHSSKCELDRRYSELGRELAVSKAEALSPTEGNAVLLSPIADNDALRALVNAAAPKVGGVTLALFGEDGAYRYVLYTESSDFNDIVKKANAALDGKGGGRAPMAQGSYKASLLEIKKYFEL